MNAPTRASRCLAAHVADPRTCEGQRGEVRIVDQTGASTAACLLHGAVLLASLDRGRVYPLNGPEGSAIVVFARAQTLPAFDFLTGPGMGRVGTVNEAAVLPSASEPEGRGDDGPALHGAQVDWSETEHDLGGIAPRLGIDYPAPSGSPSAHTERPSHLACSPSGNARSSRWTETTVSGPRGNA